MVDHLTRVTVGDGPCAERLARALSELGFVVRRLCGRTVAESVSIEAGAARRHLRALGFEDGDYQVFVEFVRQWGIM